MTNLFFYGTLCDLELLSLVLGRTSHTVKDAVLPDHAVYWVKDNPFPMILAQHGETAEGVLLEGVTDEELSRLDFYEGGFDYLTQVLSVHANGQIFEAKVFFPENENWTPSTIWKLEDWQAKWGKVARLGAAEVMSYQGKLAPEHIVRIYPAILSRAQARINAREITNVLAHSQPMPDLAQLEQISHQIPYAGFFSVEEYQLRFPQFDGSLSETVHRAIFRMADAVTILPYDPKRNRVMLIEQFRMAPYAMDDPHPWVLEPVAGRVDAGEDYETAAIREMSEEAGIELHALHEIARQYPSPGAVVEFLISYVGICDLPDNETGVSGLESEAEDIRSHIFDLDEALALADTGAMKATPLLMSLYWLDRHRAQFA